MEFDRMLLESMTSAENVSVHKKSDPLSLKLLLAKELDLKAAFELDPIMTQSMQRVSIYEDTVPKKDEKEKEEGPVMKKTRVHFQIQDDSRSSIGYPSTILELKDLTLTQVIQKFGEDEYSFRRVGVDEIDSNPIHRRSAKVKWYNYKPNTNKTVMEYLQELDHSIHRPALYFFKKGDSIQASDGL